VFVHSTLVIDYCKCNDSSSFVNSVNDSVIFYDPFLGFTPIFSIASERNYQYVLSHISLIAPHNARQCWFRMATTAIPVGKDTRDRLRLLGKKGETYDAILRRLMSFAECEEFMDRQYERLKDKKTFVSLDEL